MHEQSDSQKDADQRRRRRDSRAAAQASALSRRQLRDREQAEADAEAQHRAAAAGLSRRERREREFEERYAPQTPATERATEPAEAASTAPVEAEAPPVEAEQTQAEVEVAPAEVEVAPAEVETVEAEAPPVERRTRRRRAERPATPPVPAAPVSVPVPDPVRAPEPVVEAPAPVSRRARRARVVEAPVDGASAPETTAPAPETGSAPDVVDHIEPDAAPLIKTATDADRAPVSDGAPADTPDADTSADVASDAETSADVTPDAEVPAEIDDAAARALAVINVETVPLEIELVAQHPIVEIETAEHIAAETVLSAEADFAEPHVAPEPFSAVATSNDNASATPIPVASPRVRRSVPVAELMSSSSGTFVSHAKLQPIKQRVLAGFVMMIAALFVVSISIPSFGVSMTTDFASKQIPADVTDSQNLSVGEGPALNAVRDDFYAVGAPGSLYSTTNTVVSKESQKLAQELMAAVAAGKLKGSAPDHIPEIQALADGVVKPDCGIDLRILQVMVIAVRTFNSVAVSDINRKCTGQIEGGGTSSSHYINGGGHAVDFYLMNGASVPGADPNTIKFAEILDPIMPPGSNLGQSECRSSAGIALNLQNFKEFPDSCTHMHIDVGSATQGLNVNLDRDFK